MFDSPLSQFYIPYVRTFWPSNAPTKGVPTTVNVTSEDGTIEAQEIMEQVETEKVLKYLPHGNYKWYAQQICEGVLNHTTDTFRAGVHSRLIPQTQMRPPSRSSSRSMVQGRGSTPSSGSPFTGRALPHSTPPLLRTASQRVSRTSSPD